MKRVQTVKLSESVRRDIDGVLNHPNFQAKGCFVGILGSAAFFGDDSETICSLLGHKLASTVTSIGPVSLVGGGMDGVAYTVGREFYNTLVKEKGATEAALRTSHILPHSFRPREFGVSIPGGADLRERQEVLGSLCDLYIVVEGGPNTVHEVETLLSDASPPLVIPVKRTGGASSGMFDMPQKALTMPNEFEEVHECNGDPRADWQMLEQKNAPVEDVVDAICALVAFGANRGRRHCRPL